MTAVLQKGDIMNTTNSNFTVQEMGRIALFAALTSILAFIIVPLPLSPVPVSGQTLGVMLAGIFLKGRNAFFSQFIYILMGIIGLPIFAGGSSGIGVLLGPTGGFIWGFLIGAYIIGKLTEKEFNTPWLGNSLSLILGGVIAIYIPGVIQYVIVMGVSVKEAISVAVIPFLPGDVFKIIVGLMVSRKVVFKRVFKEGIASS